MRVFISWSGDTSRKLALHLRDWIPDVIQSVSPWVSATDIDSGKRWSNDIQELLDDCDFGVVCLTKDNLSAPWVMFEAGALAKSLSDSYVCPWLYEITPTDIPSGPLSQFQSVMANKEGAWKLVQSINKALRTCLKSS